MAAALGGGARVTPGSAATGVGVTPAGEGAVSTARVGSGSMDSPISAGTHVVYQPNPKQGTKTTPRNHPPKYPIGTKATRKAPLEPNQGIKSTQFQRNNQKTKSTPELKPRRNQTRGCGGGIESREKQRERNRLLRLEQHYETHWEI